MAKKRARKSRNKNFVAIPFDMSISLGTLANGSTIFGDVLGSALGEDLYLISIDATWTLQDAVATEGPLAFGFSHDDLTGTEVTECLGAELTDPDDIIAKERARRPVRRAGVFHSLSTNEAVNDGMPVRTKCKFSVGDGHNIHAWVYNQSGGALTVGNAIVNILGTVYGSWQR